LDDFPEHDAERVDEDDDEAVTGFLLSKLVSWPKMLLSGDELSDL
jgi:hypothetical protein